MKKYFLISILWVIGFPLVNFSYLYYGATHGWYPPDGDAVLIPAFGSVILAVLLLPVINVGVYFFLKRNRNK
jgi:hypothetical protein